MAITPVPNAQGGTIIVWTSLAYNTAILTFTNNSGAALVWKGTGSSWLPVNNAQ